MHFPLSRMAHPRQEEASEGCPALDPDQDTALATRNIARLPLFATLLSNTENFQESASDFDDSAATVRRTQHSPLSTQPRGYEDSLVIALQGNVPFIGMSPAMPTATQSGRSPGTKSGWSRPSEDQAAGTQSSTAKTEGRGWMGVDQTSDSSQSSSGGSHAVVGMFEAQKVRNKVSAQLQPAIRTPAGLEPPQGRRSSANGLGLKRSNPAAAKEGSAGKTRRMETEVPSSRAPATSREEHLTGIVVRDPLKLALRRGDVVSNPSCLTQSQNPQHAQHQPGRPKAPRYQAQRHPRQAGVLPRESLQLSKLQSFPILNKEHQQQDLQQRHTENYSHQRHAAGFAFDQDAVISPKQMLATEEQYMRGIREHFSSLAAERVANSQRSYFPLNCPRQEYQDPIRSPPTPQQPRMILSPHHQCVPPLSSSSPASSISFPTSLGLLSSSTPPSPAQSASSTTTPSSTSPVAAVPASAPSALPKGTVLEQDISCSPGLANAMPETQEMLQLYRPEEQKLLWDLLMEISAPAESVEDSTRRQTAGEQVDAHGELLTHAMQFQPFQESVLLETHEQHIGYCQPQQQQYRLQQQLLQQRQHAQRRDDRVLPDQQQNHIPVDNFLYDFSSFDIRELQLQQQHQREHHHQQHHQQQHRYKQQQQQHHYIQHPQQQQQLQNPELATLDLSNLQHSAFVSYQLSQARRSPKVRELNKTEHEETNGQQSAEPMPRQRHVIQPQLHHDAVISPEQVLVTEEQQKGGIHELLSSPAGLSTASSIPTGLPVNCPCHKCEKPIVATSIPQETRVIQSPRYQCVPPSSSSSPASSRTLRTAPFLPASSSGRSATLGVPHSPTWSVSPASISSPPLTSLTTSSDLFPSPASPPPALWTTPSSLAVPKPRVSEQNILNSPGLVSGMPETHEISLWDQNEKQDPLRDLLVDVSAPAESMRDSTGGRPTARQQLGARQELSHQPQQNVSLEAHEQQHYRQLQQQQCEQEQRYEGRVLPDQQHPKQIPVQNFLFSFPFDGQEQLDQTERRCKQQRQQQQQQQKQEQQEQHRNMRQHQHLHMQQQGQQQHLYMQQQHLQNSDRAALDHNQHQHHHQQQQQKQQQQPRSQGQASCPLMPKQRSRKQASDSALTRCPAFGRTSNKDDYTPAVPLYQFLLDELESKKSDEERFLAWVDRDRGMFRIVKKEEVAEQWGRVKNNETMTYDKFSRSLRYYYKTQKLEKVRGHSLLYKFGPRALEAVHKMLTQTALSSPSSTSPASHHRPTAAPVSRSLLDESRFSPASSMTSQSPLPVAASEQVTSTATMTLLPSSPLSLPRSFPAVLARPARASDLAKTLRTPNLPSTSVDVKDSASVSVLSPAHHRHPPSASVPRSQVDASRYSPASSMTPRPTFPTSERNPSIAATVNCPPSSSSSVLNAPRLPSTSVDATNFAFDPALPLMPTSSHFSRYSVLYDGTWTLTTHAHAPADLASPGGRETAPPPAPSTALSQPVHELASPVFLPTPGQDPSEGSFTFAPSIAGMPSFLITHTRTSSSSSS